MKLQIGGWVFVLVLAAAGAMPCAGAAETARTFYVATNGNDAWTGRFASPNPAGTDGPFATPHRALKAVAEARKDSGATRQPATVHVRRGSYFFSEPLVIGPEHSNVLLASYEKDPPVFSGGRALGGWQAATINGKAAWTAPVPQARDGKWVFRELWAGGTRAIRARSPNRGYFAIAEVPDKASSWTDGQQRFKFKAGDLAGWPNAAQAEAVAMTRWVESRLPIRSIEPAENLVTFHKRAVFELSPGDLYYVEGAVELLDEPGEWCLDSAAGQVWYLPRPGEKLEGFSAIAPWLTQVVRIEGQPEAGRFVDGLSFSGIVFSHTEWCFPGGFHSEKDKPQIWPEPKADIGGFAQAAVGVPGAVRGDGARNCLFIRCRFTNLGNYGLDLARGCQSNRVQTCEFSDLGAGGIKLGETVVRKAAAEQTRANQINDCRIFDGGKMFHSAIGIWLGQASDNALRHNLIHDFYYTGISIGWTWGYGEALATNNLVEYNHVHHIGVKSDGDGPILSDMGGIYTLSMQPGTRIVNNLWHDIAGLRYGGWGIYFDEGSSSIVAESNLVYRTTHGGFHQHYGATNIVRNNIFAFARDHQVQRSRPEPHVSFSFVTNIVYFNQGVALGGTWDNDNYRLDSNCYFDSRPNASQDMKFAGVTLEKWRERGHDRHSQVADPLFADPLKDDFALSDKSPALKMGFRPFDLKTVGPR